MTTTRIKEKISALVSSQLPEFIQSDFPTFVSFIEAYYRFLEQDQGALEVVQNARSYNDIDSTTDDFVKYFVKNYAPLLPESAIADKRFLVKKIKDLYEAKGSELSFKLLFQILFKSPVSLYYPYEFVLRASDGVWQQLNSLRLRTVTGDRDILRNRLLTYQTGGIVYTTPIIDVKNLTPTLTEVFLDSNFLAPNYSIGDTVTVLSGTTTLFTGIISPTTVDYVVEAGGLGFKVGQLYTINFGGGINTLIKISKVSSLGAVEEIKFINFGYGYTGVFSVDLDPSKTVSETVDILADRTLGFASSGAVLLSDPLDPNRYFDADYLLENSYTFTSSTEFSANTYSPASTTVTKPAQFATIFFRLGALGRYPGSFISNKGFLSEPDIRLQDSLLYQPFAYQTNTDREYEEFFGIVKKLVHPAGQNLFNNRIIGNNIDLSGNVSVAFKSNVFFEALSVVDPTDQFAAQISKLIVDTTEQLSDTQVLTAAKVINTSTDGFTETGNGFSQSYFAESYVVISTTEPLDNYIEGQSFTIV